MHLQSLQKIQVNTPFARHIAVKQQNPASPNDAANSYEYKNISLPASYFHPAFCGKNVDEFSKLMDSILAKTTSEELAKERIKEFLPKILTECTEELGDGFFAKTFKINDKYVIKQVIGETLNYKYINIMPKVKFPDLKTWYGKPLVNIEDKVFVMRNANPDNTFISAGGNINIPEFDYAKEHHAGVKRCAKIPQKAYNDIAFDMKRLNTPIDDGLNFKRNYSFDYNNPNNFMFNDREIKVVDEIGYAPEKNTNNVISMLEMLVSGYRAGNVRCRHSEQLVKPRREILKKCFIAGEHAELPMDEVRFSKETIENSLNLCEIKQNWKEIKSYIQSVREKYADTTDRANAINDYFEKLFS